MSRCDCKCCDRARRLSVRLAQATFAAGRGEMDAARAFLETMPDDEHELYVEIQDAQTDAIGDGADDFYEDLAFAIVGCSEDDEDERPRLQ